MLGLALSARATDNKVALQGLRQAKTAVERIAVLADDSDFVFNFIDPKNAQTGGAGGHTVSAAITSFPALFGAGMAMTLGFMEPCSLNSPHTHPRATEFLIMINGTVKAGFLAENGARFVVNDVPPLTATIFPKGSVHFQANLDCHPALFAAALNHEDPGTLSVAQRFFALPADVVGASLGGIGVEDVSALAKLIPDNLIAAQQECFAHCHLTPPSSQPTKQQQKPSTATTSGGSPTPSNDVEGSGTPNHWLGNGQNGDAQPDWSHNSTTSPIAKPVVNLADADVVDGTKNWFAHLDGTKIAVIVLAAVNVALLVAGIVALFVSRRRKRRSEMAAMPTVVASSVSAPRALFTGRGKYAAAEYELPHDDAASQEAIFPRKFEDPYDKPPSRAPSPAPQQQGPYRD
ncbi:RmlC-like cupin [Auricularia subglabra TFB-10046 SS5]|nr:RmlC-like cupin [Auricularia subglabra TFB-10046 SS5]